MKSHTTPLILIAGSILFLAAILLMQPVDQADGAGWNPVAQQVGTTTVVGPQGAGVVRNQVFAANDACKSRVITTPGTSAIMISFDDIATAGNVGSTTVGVGVGHYQAASTSVAYDSAMYGCGVWNVWAWASTTLTVSEF